MASPTATGLADWIKEHLATTRNIAKNTIDPNENFGRYGLDSLGAAKMMAELGTVVGRHLSPTLVWEHPTIAALAGALAGEKSQLQVSASSELTNGSTHEPIAVVGLACRLPGAQSPLEFWKRLCDGADLTGEVPPSRWDEKALRGGGVDSLERSRTRRGAFLQNVRGFDPLFWSISPREASQMDPQQRLLLELAWEALEDAGIPPSSLRGSSAGVYIGAIWSDYSTILSKAGPNGIDRYTVTGTHHSILANRISYVLGLQGPSMSIDSACSSGLVVTHLATQSLRSGEATLAVCGAVNLNLLAESALSVSKFGALSQDGTCYTFDQRANGYVRGEGGGVIILKLLSRAVADGDPIYCVLRGGAVNNDGASNGLTAPNPKAQQAVLRGAYHASGVDPSTVQYVEAHGTGTPLGDPIEANALGAVLGQGRSAENPLVIGSAKTNIGHLEGAAGIAGLVKVALSVRERLLPSSQHFSIPNPHANLQDNHLHVTTALGPWPEGEKRLVAGVSSFGLGGTNSHVVVEEWPAPPTEAFLLGAASTHELKNEISAAAAALRSSAKGITLREFCATTLQKGRSGPYHLTALARSHKELERALQGWLDGQPGPAVTTNEAVFKAGGNTSPLSGGVAFVFPGQGAQWGTMAVSLLAKNPVYRDVLSQCDAAVQRELGWSLLQEFAAGGPRFDNIEVSLPAIISLDIATASWWRSMGIQPTAVVGHSTGEIAAACVAGALDLNDTMRVICAYGKLITRMSNRGTMALVGLRWDQAAQVISGYEGKVYRAIEDSADATVLAGVPEAIDGIVEELQNKGIFARRVAMNVSPHCPLVDSLRDELYHAIQGIRPQPTHTPFYSEVTGGQMSGTDLGPEHWVKNFGDPAYFSRAINELIARGHRTFIDVGPHPITKHSVETNLKRAGVSGRVFSSMRRNEDERTTLLDTAAALDALGAPVKWEELYPEAARDSNSETPQILPLSAKTSQALSELAGSYAELLKKPSAASLRDIVSTAARGRDHLRCRAAFVGNSKHQLALNLAAFARGEPGEFTSKGQSPVGGPPSIVFVLPGQGSQWVGMGRQLFATEPAFRRALETCDKAISAEAGFSVIQEMAANEGESRLSEIDVVQPMLFAMEVALGELWKSWGITPDAVVGHSMGETAAAYLAGILTMEDAAKVICRRSKLLRKVRGQGAMGLVELTLPETAAVLSGREAKLSVAVSNGPRSTVISGDPAALDEVFAELEKKGIYCKRVKVDVASHSPQMDALTADLLAALSDVQPRAGQIPMRSTVTGETVNGTELTAEYWVHNLRKPVLFADAVSHLAARGPTVFVELSPHPLLLPSIQENLHSGGFEGTAVGSTRRNEDELTSIRRSLADVYTSGASPSWDKIAGAGTRVTGLPHYPWQRQDYWVEASANSESHSPTSETGAFLATVVESSSHPGERIFETVLSTERDRYLNDHRVGGEVIFPGAAMVEMALEATYPGDFTGPLLFNDIRFVRMLSLADKTARVQLVETPLGGGQTRVAIASRAAGQTDWVTHATLNRADASSWNPSNSPTLKEIRERCVESLSGSAFYERATARGLEYGPSFRGLQNAARGDGEAVAHIKLPDETPDQAGYLCHPAFLDACFQASLTLFFHEQDTLVPIQIGRLKLDRRPGREAWLAVQSRGELNGSRRRVDLSIFEMDGTPIGWVEDLQLQALPSARRVTSSTSDVTYAVAWRPAEGRRAENAAGKWLVVADEAGFSKALGERIRHLGGIVIEAESGTAYGMISPLHYQLNPALPGQFEKVLRDALERHKDLRGVVSCTTLDVHTWPPESEAALRNDLTRGAYTTLLIVQALIGCGARNIPPLFTITRAAHSVVGGPEPVRPAATAVWGLLKTAGLEQSLLANRRIDLPSTPLPDEVERVVAELVSTESEDQVALRAEGRFVARLTRADLDSPELKRERLIAAGERSYRLDSTVPGTLDGLTLLEQERRRPGPEEVEVEVEAAGLNFLDVLAALRALPGNDTDPVGWECSGRISAVGGGVHEWMVGQEVVVVAPHSFASHVIARRELVAPKPTHLSFEEAAALPIARMTVHHALKNTARLQAGERILIHSATGGIGLAALDYAKHVGAEIFATAGNAAKRELLGSKGVPRVFDSRSLSFATDIQKATGGEGIDVVLNSVSGDLLVASFELLRDGGRFVELGKRDYYENQRLGLRPFLRNLSLSLVDLQGLILKKPQFVGELLREVVSGAAANVYTTPKCKVFSMSRASEAFRLMANAEHTGKIVLRPDRNAPVVPCKRAIRSDRTYLITGGLGGLGLSLAKELAAKGAKHLLLCGRSAPSPSVASEIAQLERGGTRVRTQIADISAAKDVEALFQYTSDHPPVGGIAHVAGLLNDRTLTDLSDVEFWTPMLPKAFGAYLLDRFSRREPLDFFVVYSSVASVLGSGGQAAYAGANAFLDGVAQARANLGEVSTAIQWGLFADVGMAAGQDRRAGRLATQGILPLKSTEGSQFCTRLIESGVTGATFLRLDPRQWVEAHPHVAHEPFLSELLNAQEKATFAQPGFLTSLAGQSRDHHLQRMCEYVAENLGKVLRLDPSKVDQTAPFTSLGVDSLAGLELRNRLEAGLGVRLSASILFTYSSTARLARYLLDTVLPQPDNPSQQAANDLPTNQGARGPDMDADAGSIMDDNRAMELLQDFEDFLQ
ncbi:MAG: SDR family NAD(P)-dependent oxidoreductase [Polyangiaceae bacterium]|nr:SDR family NAD(P)-dependent oxidoreductase [Polyangiaceae bacterium]